MSYIAEDDLEHLIPPPPGSTSLVLGLEMGTTTLGSLGAGVC